MNLLKFEKNYYSIYWEKNFLTNDEIEKIKTYARTLITENAKVGQEKKEKKEFTLDYHIKDPNKGVVPRTRITDIKWIRLNENTNWLFKKIIDKIIDVNSKNFDLQLKFVEDLQFSEYTEENQRQVTQSLRTMQDKLNTSYQQELKNEQGAFNYFLS